MEEYYKYEVPFYNIISKLHIPQLLKIVDVDFDHLTEVMFIRLLHCKDILSYLLSLLYSLEEILYVQPTLKEWEHILPFL